MKSASDDITGLINPLHGFDPQVVNVRMAELNAYFSDVIEQRRVEPRDHLIYTSVQATPRSTTAPISVGGKPIPAGKQVAILWGLANRDVRRWPDADKLCLGRPDPKPLSFGHGIHHCLGASLARLELRVAIPAFLDAFGDYQLSPANTHWKRSLTVRGPTALPITRPAAQGTHFAR